MGDGAPVCHCPLYRTTFSFVKSLKYFTIIILDGLGCHSDRTCSDLPQGLLTKYLDFTISPILKFQFPRKDRELADGSWQVMIPHRTCHKQANPFSWPHDLPEKLHLKSFQRTLTFCHLVSHGSCLK